MTKVSSTKTIREELLAFRRANGFCANEKSRKIWLAQLGNLIVPLPNFAWRRNALDRHDAHHLLTGLSTSATDEILLASWELGARCFLDWRAKALCQFLLVLGLGFQPRRTRAAFQTGRAHSEAYRHLLSDDFLDMPVIEAKTLLNPQ